MHARAAPDFRIRPYAPSDRNACVAIFRSNLPRYFDSSEQPEFEEFLDQLSQEYFVVELGGSVLACGGCHIRDGVGRLSWGMVLQSSHGASMGTNLLTWRIDRLFLQASVSEIRIDTSQHTAGFFARHGFRTTHHIPNGYGTGIDQVSMALLRDDWRA